MRRRIRDEHGAAAVEFALVLPILVMLLFGIITAGMAFSQSISLSDGVRDGARFGATTPQGGSWNDTVIDQVRTLQADDAGSATSVCVDIWNGSSNQLKCANATVALGASDAPSPPTNMSSDCVVRVWSARPYEINIGIAQIPGVMRRQTVVRYERTCP